MQVALVTGPNRGIGKAIALGLVASQFHVVAAGRSEERIQALTDEIEELGGTAEYLALDLSSLDSCRDAALEFSSTGRNLDLLVNNAGIGVNRRGITPDGFEPHFGINHLGHFMLTMGLRPAFRRGTRIVQVTSSVHFRASGIDFDDLQRPSSFGGLDEYAISKLANVLFVREFARRQDQWSVYAAHPGLVDTGLIPWFMKPFLRRRMLTPEQGAETPLWCALSDEVADETGLYYTRRQAVPPSPPAQDSRLAQELWERSEDWCRITPES